MENQSKQTDFLPTEPQVTEEMVRQLIKQQKAFLEAKRAYCLEDFWEFSKEVIGWKDLYEPLHQPLCDFVQMNRNKKRMIWLPRGHLKSSVITVGYSLWRIAQNPKIRILISNATGPLALTFLKQIKDHLLKNQKFIELFGDLATGAQQWSEEAITIARPESFEAKESTVTAYGIGGSLTSQHYDILLLDDLVNRENIHTADRIHDVIQFYKDVMDLRDNVDTSEVIIIGTRWHEGDLYGWLMDEDNPAHHEFMLHTRTAIEGDYQITKNPTAGRFEIEGGEVIFPNKFTRRGLEKLIDDKGLSDFSCTPAETPILMADWTMKPISEVKAGDMVVGFTRGTHGKGNRSRLVQSKVLRTFSKLDKVNSFKMESGRKVRCTQEHKWYSGRLENNPTGHKAYKQARVGSKLQFICPLQEEISEDKLREWQYLAGMFDGEGSTKSSACLAITQAHLGSNKPVYEKIIKTLKFLGIEYGEYERKHTNPKWQNNKMIWLRNSFGVALNFIRLTDLGKKQQLIDNLYKRSTQFVRQEDRILDIIEDGIETVYALETETGNYVAWGYGSSNSQYLNDPVPSSEATFKHEFKYYEIEDIKGLERRTFITLDPAFFDPKAKNIDTDPAAFVVVDVDKNNSWYIRDIIRKRMTPNEILNMIFELDTLWKPVTFGIESTAMQKILGYRLKEMMVERGHSIPITELSHAGQNAKSKAERIQALEPRYAVGTIFHNRNIRHMTTLEMELRRFPRGKTDDIADALASMLEIAHKPRVRNERVKGRVPNYPA